MNWFNILKNAKLSGKAKGKGTTLSSDRIKIKKPKEEECKEKLAQFVKNAKNLGLHPRAVITDERFFQNIQWGLFPERMACKALAYIQRDFPSKEEIYDAPNKDNQRNKLLKTVELDETYSLNKFLMRAAEPYDFDKKELPRGSFEHYFSYSIGVNMGRMLPHGTTNKPIWGIMLIFHSTPEKEEIEGNHDWRK